MHGARSHFSTDAHSPRNCRQSSVSGQCSVLSICRLHRARAWRRVDSLASEGLPKVFLCWTSPAETNHSSLRRVSEQPSSDLNRTFADDRPRWPRGHGVWMTGSSQCCCSQGAECNLAAYTVQHGRRRKSLKATSVRRIWAGQELTMHIFRCNGSAEGGQVCAVYGGGGLGGMAPISEGPRKGW